MPVGTVTTGQLTRSVEHGAHLFGGGQHEGAIAREVQVAFSAGHPAQTLTEEKVLGIILVDSMVGMYHRAVAPAGHPLCQHKGRKLALRMDDLRPQASSSSSQWEMAERPAALIRTPG